MVAFLGQIVSGGCARQERNVVQKTGAPVVSYGRRCWGERFGFNWVLVECFVGVLY